MNHPKLKDLAQSLLSYSVCLKEGENLMIELIDEGEDLAEELIKEAYAMGARPFLQVRNMRLSRAQYINVDELQLKMMADWEIQQANAMHAHIVIVGELNSAELSDIPPEKQQLRRKLYGNPVFKAIEKKNWCLLNYPNYAMASKAGMSLSAFEDFYFDVCGVDYARMDKAMDPLVELMQRTDKVRITGRDTNLSFSIKGLPAIKCAGKVNIPDGEIFTAPVKDSVNGVITYNTPSQFNGTTFDNVRLEFKNGKIIKATASDTDKINRIFETDEGASFVGEFALGVNPYITRPMNDILFDEKIRGSFHFTPGSCYDICSNGNQSSVHWDLVFIQTPEFGGGEIWFDDILVRKDGLFMLPELEALNPENLK